MSSTSSKSNASNASNASSTSNQEWTPERVRAIRESKGWTLKAAAEHAGVNLRTWQAWEQPEGPSQRRPRGAAAKILGQLEHAKTSKKN